MSELRHVKQIVGDSTHDLPHLGIIIEGIRQTLQVCVGIPAHVCLDLRPHHMAVHRHVIVCHHIDQSKHQIQPCQLSDQRKGQQSNIRHGPIGDKPHDQRQYDLTDGGQRRTEQVCEQYPFVIFIIGQEPTKQFT